MLCATAMAAPVASTATNVRTSPNRRTATDANSAKPYTPATPRTTMSNGSIRNESRVVPVAVTAIDSKQNR